MHEITNKRQFEALCEEPIFGCLAKVEPRIKDALKTTTRVILDGQVFYDLKEEISKHTPRRLPDSPKKEWWHGPVVELKIGTLVVSQATQSAQAGRLLTDYRKRLAATLELQELDPYFKARVLQEASLMSAEMIKLLS